MGMEKRSFRRRGRSLRESGPDENAYVGFSPVLHPGLPSAPLGPMGKLTTHVLDTASGNPAGGVHLRLYRGEELLADTLTNADGRCDAPLLDDAIPGEYRLVFQMGDYFRAHGVASPFLNEIPIHFNIETGRNYHVPLACSPFSYSTYRGS
jgi:5-hydroxyisourate hydrolase